MSEVDHHEDPNVRYDRLRCRVCGHHWMLVKDEETGAIYAGHPYGQTCSRYKPEDAISDVPPSFTTEPFITDHPGVVEVIAANHTNGKHHAT